VVAFKLDTLVPPVAEVALTTIELIERALCGKAIGNVMLLLQEDPHALTCPHWIIRPLGKIWYPFDPIDDAPRLIPAPEPLKFVALTVPVTSSWALGLAVPIPTLPLA
jgi:hypothetical protein